MREQHHALRCEAGGGGSRGRRRQNQECVQRFSLLSPFAMMRRNNSVQNLWRAIDRVRTEMVHHALVGGYLRTQKAPPPREESVGQNHNTFSHPTVRNEGGKKTGRGCEWQAVAGIGMGVATPRMSGGRVRLEPPLRFGDAHGHSAHPFREPCAGNLLRLLDPASAGIRKLRVATPFFSRHRSLRPATAV